MNYMSESRCAVHGNDGPWPVEMPDETQLLLAACRSFCSGETGTIPDSLIKKEIPWEAAVQQAHEHGIESVLYNVMRQTPLPASVPSYLLARMRQEAYMTVERNLRVLRTLQAILPAFAGAGVNVVLLKGPALIAEGIYGDIGTRETKDIDILIKKEDADAVHRILTSLGYKCEPVRRWLLQEYYCLEYYHLKEYKLEIHWELFMPEDFRQASAVLPSAVLWNQVKEVSLDRNRVFVLADEAGLLYACLHFAKHCKKNDYRLLWALDIALVLRKKEKVLDWNRFHELAVNSGQSAVVRDVLSFVRNAIGTEKGAIGKHLPSPAFTVPQESQPGKELRSLLFLRRIMSIPGFYAKAATLFEYSFPSREVLLWRYNAGKRHPAFRRLFHPLFLLRKATAEIMRRRLRRQ